MSQQEMTFGELSIDTHVLTDIQKQLQFTVTSIAKNNTILDCWLTRPNAVGEDDMLRLPQKRTLPVSGIDFN